jgi:hypothetical protein
MDVSDWVRTLGNLAGCDFSNETLDSIDQWPMINDGISLRNEIVNVDNVFNYSAIINETWKIVKGSLDPPTDGWISNRSSLRVPWAYPLNVLLSRTNSALSGLAPPLSFQKINDIQKSVQVNCRGSGFPCLPRSAACLFNIFDDPCEENNLANDEPIVLNEMKLIFNDWLSRTAHSNRKKADTASNPNNFGGVWQWWQPDAAI